MHSDTPLDYAEFQLTPRRTRCELLVSAEGVTEKLASGFCKPFVSHLRVAEVQVARGSQAIRLEQQPKFSKRTGRPWFTKGTLERFERFVSGPEVIERVKFIEDELAQLEQVRRALATTFTQTDSRFRSIDNTLSSNGADHGRDGLPMMPRWDSTHANKTEPDASKLELLKAMDVRLTALRQEQNMAFSRAAAAGFDNHNMGDLMTFAEHFGAHRLGDACVQYIALLKKKTGIYEKHEEMDYSSAKANSSGSDISLGKDTRTRSKLNTQRNWDTSEKPQMDYPLPTILQDSLRSGSTTKVNKEFASQTHPDGKRLTEDPFSAREEFCVAVNPTDGSILPQHASDTVSGSNQRHNCLDQGSESDAKGGVLFAHLQQKAQIEARMSSGDLGIGISDQSRLAFQVTTPESSSIGLEHMWNSSESSHPCTRQASGDDGHTQFQYHEAKNLPAKSPLSERGLPLSAQTAQIGSPCIGRSSSSQGVNVSLPQYGVRKEEKMTKPVEGEGSRAKDDKEEEFVSTSVRRLSVQDAINLFESKKKNSAESPVKKLVKQESRRGSMEICSSPTFEKAVLKRWSGINLPTSGENCEQEKTIVLDSAEARKCEELDFTKDRDGANNNAVKDSKLVHDTHIQPVVDEQEMEKKKTSLGRVVANLIHTQQHEQTCSSTTPEMGVISNKLLNRPSGVLQRQFEVELMNNLTMEEKNQDVIGAITSLNSKVESRNTAMSSTMKPVKDLVSEPKNESQSIVNSTISDKKVTNEQEQRGNGRGNFVPTLRATVTNGPKLSTKASMEQDGAEQKTVAHSKQKVLALKESDIVKFKGLVDDVDQPSSKIGSRNVQVERHQKPGKEFSDDIRNTPADSHMQALLKMTDDDQCHEPMNLSSEESQSQVRGRFYDHYERLRDARLRGAPPAKKAERQAKLKLMQETLERRKAEMKEKALVRPKKNPRMPQTQSGLQKLQAQKAGAALAQKEQHIIREEEQGIEEEGTDQEDSLSQVQDHLYGYSNPASPASTPRSSNNQASSLKQQTAKKTASTPIKPSTALRTSTRSAAVSLPRSNLRSSVGSPNQRKLPTASQSPTMDNSIAKSAANAKDSKKEIKKPSAGRMVSSAKVHPKLNGNLQIVSDAVSLTDDGNTTANDDSLSATPDQEETKHQSSLVRKSCTSVPYIKTSSAELVDVVVLESLGGQEVGVTNSIVNGRVRQTAVSVSQEGKSFLHKDQGIGSGAGPGSMKQNICNPGDASKTSDGDAPADLVVNRDLADSENLRRGILFTKSPVTQKRGGSADSEFAVASNVLAMDISNNDGSSSGNKDESGNTAAETLACLAEDAFDGVRVGHNAFCSDDLCKEKHTGALAMDLVSVAQDLFPTIITQKQKDRVVSASLSQLLTESNIGSLQSNTPLITPAAASRVASLPHEHITSLFSPAGASLANASMQQLGTVSGHFSPPAAMALESPLGSPASWISSQSQYASEADLVRSRRQLNGPHKPASAMTHVPKETAKGFKRLLHFGRKSRASEMPTTDCVSASTTSEGDDDAEETKDLGSQSSDGLLRRTRMQEKGFEFGNYGDHYSYQDQGAIQFLPSSIPAPPANFKLREDHLAGGTLLKAPRSFFSLSTFRSRGSEGKSR